MCRKLSYLISFVLVLCLVGDAQAVDQNWTGAGGDQFWSTAANWDTGTVPASADRVLVRTLPGPTIVNEGAVADSVHIGIGDGTIGALTVDGGTLTATSWSSLARDSGGEG
jgi:hypothetical protein